MPEEVVGKDVLFVLLNDSRYKILHFLQQRNDYASSRQISSATQISMSNVSFHCDKLVKRGMINKEVESGKAMFLINVKGIRVVQEVDEHRQKKGTAGTHKKNRSVGNDESV